MITAKVAWRLRSERGLLLPVGNFYEDVKVADIAVEQKSFDGSHGDFG